MFTAALFTTVRWKHLECPSTDEWGMWTITHTLKRNEVLIRAAMKMNPGHVILSERRPTQVTYHIIPLTEVSRIREFIETEGRLVVTMGMGGAAGHGNRERLLTGYRVFFWGDDMF